jgi:hypothetical protein
MKTLLLIAALVGFSFGASAQNSSCGKKKVHHKVVRHKYVHKTKKHKKAPAVAYIPPKETPGESCYVYKQHNIMVTECPHTFYENSGSINFSVEHTYMGYFPTPPQPDEATKHAEEAKIAPQVINMSNYHGTAPESGNYPGCPQVGR